MENKKGLLIIIFILLFLCNQTFAADPLKMILKGAIYFDEKKIGFMQPEGIGCNRPSILLIADSGNERLVQYSMQDNAFIPLKEIRLPQITYPIRVQMNSKGEVFVLNGSSRKIARISPTGEFNGYIGFEGVPGSENIVPRSFLIDDKDNIHVLDVYSGRVLSLGPSGVYMKGVSIYQKYGFISDLAVDSFGTIYLIDSIEGKILYSVKDSTEFSLLVKNLKEYCDFPISLAVDNKGHIFVLDKNGSRVIILGKEGSFGGQQLSMGWKEGFLRYPSQICLDNQGDVIIADGGNNRVQIFSISE